MISTHTIELKSPKQMDRMRRAGQLLAEVFDEVLAVVGPGVTTKRVDQVANEAILARDAKPAFLGYRGFPATICASVNEEVVHGIPSDRALREGDILGIDIGLVHDGFFADRATTVPVAPIAPAVAQLLRVTRQCLEQAIEVCRPGNRLHAIGQVVQELAEGAGFGVVRDYSGHGIGRQLHEPPQVPNFVPNRSRDSVYAANPRLRVGMALAIEPMINLGVCQTETLDDGWTVVTADRQPSAHFEHTVLITETGPEALTGQQPEIVGNGA